MVASVVTAAWAGWLAATAPVAANLSSPQWFLLELGRYAAWFFVLSGVGGFAGPVRLLVPASYAACIGLLPVGMATLALRPASLGWITLLGGIALSAIGLVAMEQTFRAAVPAARRSLKYLFIGLAGLFIYDLLLFSQTALPAAVAEDMWVARGYVAALAVPLLGFASARGLEWSSQLFLSRGITFGAFAVVAIGSYLAFVVLGMEMLRSSDSSWGRAGSVILGAAALVLLAALAGSAFLRRRVRVWLVKNFYRHKYDYRREWLRFIATLSEGVEDEDARETALRAIAQIIASPGAVLIMREEGRSSFGIGVGWPRDELSAGVAGQLGTNDRLLQLLGDREWVVDLDEYRSHRERYGQLELPEGLTGDQTWRLIVPVMLREQLAGMVLLQDPPGGFTLTFEDRDLLKTVARHVATHLAQLKSEERLAEARRFEAYNRLSAFLMHDLKNAAAPLDLVVRNAKRHGSNPEFIADAIDTVAAAAVRITRLIEQLSRGSYVDRAETLGLEEVVMTAVKRAEGSQPVPELLLETRGLRVSASRERLINVIEHLIRNAQEVTRPDGRVAVRLREQDGCAVIEVSDDGPGMSRQFIRDRLFRPFDGTKGSGGMGIGVYQAREYARSLGGDVTVESEPERGTTFQLRVPIASVAAVA